MVKKYDVEGEIYDIVQRPSGRYVLAADYAALAAERDEWKRRCEKMESILPQDYGCDFERDLETYAINDRRVREEMYRVLHPQYFIAKGRDA